MKTLYWSWLLKIIFIFLYVHLRAFWTENTVVSLKHRELLATMVYYVHRLIAVHSAHVCVHIWRHLRPFAAVRALEFWLLTALEPHMLLHIAQVLVTVAALGTQISPMSFVSLLLLCHILGVPIRPEGVRVPEASAVVTL